MNKNLSDKFSRGFSEPNLRNMRKFYSTYSQTQIQHKASVEFQSTEIEEDVIWQKASAKLPQFTLSWPHYLVTIHDTVHDEQVTEQVNNIDKQVISYSTKQVTEQVTTSTEHVTIHVTDHVTDHVSMLIKVIENDISRNELLALLKIRHRQHFTIEYLQPALEKGLIEMTIPDKPKSILQKYRLTAKGKALKEKLGGLKDE